MRSRETDEEMMVYENEMDISRAAVTANAPIAMEAFCGVYWLVYIGIHLLHSISFYIFIIPTVELAF